MRDSSKKMSDKKLAIIISSIFSAAALIGVVAALAVKFVPSLPYFNQSSSQISSEISSQITQVESDASSSISQTESGLVYESDDGTNFSVPDKLRAVYLKAGQDFILKTTDTQSTIKSQIDNALKSTKKLGFNSVIIFTNTSQGLLFEDSALKSLREDFDVLEYALSSAKAQNLYTYVVYPVLVTEKNGKIVKIGEFTEDTLKQTSERARAFSKKYQPSGIIFDDYSVSKSDTMQLCYEASKSTKSYEAYLREQVTLNIREARNAMRKNNKTSQIGFLSSGVWANAATNQNGSQTSSDYESYVDGFADTRDFVLNEKFNFVMVENMMPTDSVKNNFEVIAKWWSSLCSAADIPFYNVHASSKLHGSLGEFSSPDQLIRQVTILDSLKTFSGSAFDSLSALVADKDGSTSLLLKYYNNQIKDKLVFSKLSMVSPAKNKVETYDSTISFSGATDPNFKTTFKGQTVTVTEKGYFSFDAQLEIGTNTFKITHKGKTATYTVVRKVKLLESVSPVGSIEIDGDTSITLSVKGYSGSKITANIAGKTVNLIEKEADDASDDVVTSQYVTFEGNYKVPAAKETVQNLGTIKFTASWKGFSESMTGAAIKIFAKPAPPALETQKAVQITAKFAETFPTTVLNDQSQPYCYPLPAGTVDYVVGNELVFTSGSSVYKYYKLQSGQRVYSKDVKVLGNIEKTSNEISAVNITYDGRFLNIKVDNKWSVPFKYIEEPISYGSDGVTLRSDYQISKVTYRIFHTDKIDLNNVKMQDNPLVSKVEYQLKTVKIDSVDVKVCDIVLTLRTKGGYFGTTPAYENNNKTLNLRLNTAAPIQKAQNAYGYTLKGAVIVVDAGHDKLSPGAPGVLMDNTTNNPKYPEYIMNEQMRDRVVSILKNLGATVVTVDNSVDRTAEQRFIKYHASNPHLMISIHHNSAATSSAIGPVGTYFNSYSQLLAKSIMDSVKANYVPSGSNRANHHDFSRLLMTREQYYPSMLIECGFISNAKQQEDLIKPENQEKIAQQIVKGLINYFVKTGSTVSQEYLDNMQSNSSQSNPSSSQDSLTSSSLSQSEQLAYIEPKRRLF